MWHESENRPTVHVARMDIKTAVNVARPKHVANTRRVQDVHGWITVALLREITGLDGQATFDNVERRAVSAR